jgi:hypothetical protein
MFGVIVTVCVSGYAGRLCIGGNSLIAFEVVCRKRPPLETKWNEMAISAVDMINHKGRIERDVSEWRKTFISTERLEGWFVGA